MYERDITETRRKTSPLAYFAGGALVVSFLLIGYLLFFAGEESGRAGNIEAPPAITEPLPGDQ